MKKEIYWRAPQSRALLREIYGDVRMLAEDTGLMNPIAKILWRILRIDGPASRYRSEPVRQTVAVA